MANDLPLEEAFVVAEHLPEGSVSLGYVAVYVYMNPEGSVSWNYINTYDGTSVSTLGILEATKMGIFKQCEHEMLPKKKKWGEEDDQD